MAHVLAELNQVGLQFLYSGCELGLQFGLHHLEHVRDFECLCGCEAWQEEVSLEGREGKCSAQLTLRHVLL